MFKNLYPEVFYAAEILVIAFLNAVVSGAITYAMMKALAPFSITPEPTIVSVAVGAAAGFIVSYVASIVFVSRSSK